jgi:hypothetical protein
VSSCPCTVNQKTYILISHVHRFLLKSLNDTYTRSPDEVPRLSLWDPQLMLTRLYVAQDNMHKALESAGKVLVLLGFIFVGADATSVAFKIVKWGIVVDHLVETFLHARNAFGAFGAMSAWEDAKRAEEYARTAYKIVVGEDTSFESSYGAWVK